MLAISIIIVKQFRGQKGIIFLRYHTQRTIFAEQQNHRNQGNLGFQERGGPESCFVNRNKRGNFFLCMRKKKWKMAICHNPSKPILYLSPPPIHCTHNYHVHSNYSFIYFFVFYEMGSILSERHNL